MGVPQGTILGLLLFILYNKDLLLDMPENEIVSYADDTVVISIAKTWHEVESKMNDILQKTSKWLALNKLSLNADKTVYMEFGSQCDSTPKKFKHQYNWDKNKKSRKYQKPQPIYWPVASSNLIY